MAFFIIGKDSFLGPCNIQLVKFHHLSRLLDSIDVLLVSAIDAEVEITHKKVDVSDGIRLDHILHAKKTDFFEDALSH